MTAAPLAETADAPLPQGARGFWYEGAGGARLRAAAFPALGAARGSVVLSGGRTEPIEKYFEVIGELQGRGFAVLAHDWRGQGLSQRLLPDRHKGHADGHADFLEDLRLLLAETSDELPRPWIALGHSMGGALSALAAVRGVARFEGLFLSAPMMGLTAVRRFAAIAPLIAGTMIGLGRGGHYIMKDGFEPMLGPFEGNVLTHDQRRYERFRGQLAACPDLALGGVTWGWLAFALGAGAALGRASAAKAVLGTPLAVVGAGEDHLVLNGPARRFAERAGGRYVEIAGALHEVLMETDDRRAMVWAEFDALAARVSPPPA
jgi:alpha-beta hydrolase superfamily lysophospholipase